MVAIVEGMLCPDCRTPMKALGTTTYCAWCDDFAVEEPTRPTHCPSCKSEDIAPFPHALLVNAHHCAPCGSVF